MPIDLHPRCTERLKSQLPEALRLLTIISNHYVDYDSISPLQHLDSVLPDHGDAREQLERAVGRHPFSTFVLDRLRDVLQSTLPFDPDAREPLGELPLEESVDEMAERFVAEFLTLPWDYAFLYQLPNDAVDPLLPDARSEFRLAPHVSFVRWTPGQQELFELPVDDVHSRFRLALLGAARPADGAAYLQTIHSGYVPQFGSAPAAEEAERTLRAVCGLGLALGIWARGSAGWLAGLIGPARSHVLVWRRTDGGWADMDLRPLPTELGEAISRLHISVPLKRLGEEAVALFASSEFGKVRVLFETEQGRVIARACRWLFDSYVGSSELLSFIQATVSAEILLGDKAASDLTGLTELLANRCAYLVGESRSQREELLAQFRDIYRTRSRIVHRGLDQLDPDDEDRLWTLRWLCMRIIQRELDLLLKD